MLKQCERHGCVNQFVPGVSRGRKKYCSDECMVVATEHTKKERSKDSKRALYALRRESGVCVQCGGRRDGSRLRCERCSERKRGYDAARIGRHDLQPRLDAEDPVTCGRCCDLPWRRPHNRTCDCGGEYSPEQVGNREIATAASRSERWLNW